MNSYRGSDNSSLAYSDADCRYDVFNYEHTKEKNNLFYFIKASLTRNIYFLKINKKTPAHWWKKIKNRLIIYWVFAYYVAKMIFHSARQIFTKVLLVYFFTYSHKSTNLHSFIFREYEFWYNKNIHPKPIKLNEKKSNFIISPNIRPLHSKAKQTRIKKAGQRFTYYHRRRKRGPPPRPSPPRRHTIPRARAWGLAQRDIVKVFTEWIPGVGGWSERRETTAAARAQVECYWNSYLPEKFGELRPRAPSRTSPPRNLKARASTSRAALA